VALTRRQRKLIGAFAMLAFVIFYALVAMALAQARPLQEASKLVQGISYAVMGIAWIIPIFPLIKWMEGGRDNP
jgi:L-lactate permease